MRREAAPKKGLSKIRLRIAAFRRYRRSLGKLKPTIPPGRALRRLTLLPRRDTHRISADPTIARARSVIMRKSGPGPPLDGAVHLLPFSPCGRRWRAAPDEGSLYAETTPHPNLESELRSPRTPTRGEGARERRAWRRRILPVETAERAANSAVFPNAASTNDVVALQGLCA